ncbi:MAG: hypothetical protein ACI9BW_003017 [Gammaproteobacteria bacterium]|jgi:hypothetical protein
MKYNACHVENVYKNDESAKYQKPNEDVFDRALHKRALHVPGYAVTAESGERRPYRARDSPKRRPVSSERIQQQRRNAANCTLFENLSGEPCLTDRVLTAVSMNLYEASKHPLFA